jgi:hypothetical protein
MSLRSRSTVSYLAMAAASRPEEFHLQPLSEPYVTLSRHTAPIIQP